MARTAITSARTAIASARTAIATRRPVVRDFPYSIRLSGASSYFNIPNANALEDLFVGGSSFITWFKAEASSAAVVFPIYSPTSSVQGWWLQFDSGGTYPVNRVRFGSAYTASNRLYKTPLLSLPYNRWICAQVSYNASTPETVPIITLNGVNQTITASGTGTEYLTDDTKAWRSSNGAANTNLVVGGEMRWIKGKQMTLTEMQDYYYDNTIPVGGTLLAHYKFADGAGASVTDASGNGNTMSLNGTYEWLANEGPEMGKLRTVIS